MELLQGFHPRALFLAVVDAQHQKSLCHRGSFFGNLATQNLNNFNQRFGSKKELFIFDFNELCGCSCFPFLANKMVCSVLWVSVL